VTALPRLLRAFFTSETVSSDEEVRRQMVWILTFLPLPGILLLNQVFFDYQGIASRHPVSEFALRSFAPAERHRFVPNT